MKLKFVAICLLNLICIGAFASARIDQRTSKTKDVAFSVVENDLENGTTNPLSCISQITIFSVDRNNAQAYVVSDLKVVKLAECNVEVSLSDLQLKSGDGLKVEVLTEGLPYKSGRDFNFRFSPLTINGGIRFDGFDFTLSTSSRAHYAVEFSSQNGRLILINTELK